VVAARFVEIVAIDIATRYAEANGYRSSDATAVGLVLAGMAIAAACGPEEERRLATVAAELGFFRA
jgi:hypothetical protein